MKACKYCGGPYFDGTSPREEYCDLACFLAAAEDQWKVISNTPMQPGETLVCCGSDNSCHESSCYFMRDLK